MKVTANLSFAGAELSMFRGEVRDVPERIAAPLLKCGYLEVAEPAAAEPAAAASSEMTKSELIQKAESMGIEVKSGWTKAEIAAAIAAAAEA